MKFKTFVFASLLFIILTITVSTPALAGFTIRLEKDLPMSEVTGGVPSNITFTLYESELTPTPIATQTFPGGSWSADYDFAKYSGASPESIVRVSADFTNTDLLTKDMTLWLEMKIDDVVKGPRELVRQEAWALFAREAVYTFNPLYPDGLQGIIPIMTNLVIPYTVPAGKNLHMLNCTTSGGNYILINGFALPRSSGCNPHTIAGEGDVISEQTGAAFIMNGYLVDAKVSPITIGISAPVPYTIPAGKNLFINHPASFLVDGTLINITPDLNPHPIILGPGMVLSVNGLHLVGINGFLVDQ